MYQNSEIIAVAVEACQEIENHFKKQGIGYENCRELAKLMHIDNFNKTIAITVGKCMANGKIPSLLHLSGRLSMIELNPGKVNLTLRDFCKCLARNR